jgi:hypothetical protein
MNTAGAWCRLPLELRAEVIVHGGGDRVFQLVPPRTLVRITGQKIRQSRFETLEVILGPGDDHFTVVGSLTTDTFAGSKTDRPTAAPQAGSSGEVIDTLLGDCGQDVPIESECRNSNSVQALDTLMTFWASRRTSDRTDGG